MHPLAFFCFVESSFIAYLRVERRYSPHTIQSYENDLGQFQAYIDAFHEGHRLQDAQPYLIRNWIVELMDQGYAVRSVQRKLSTLKSYYRYLKRLGERSDNPMAAIVNPKAPKRLPQFVEAESMTALFWNEDMFSEDFSGLRDRCMLMTLYGTGMRLSELIGLKESDWNGAELKVLGKRNKERIVPVAQGLNVLLSEYLEAKEQLHPQSEHLFILDNGNKLYPKFVYRRVNQYLGRVTTLTKRSPHVLRHTFATHMLENGAELQSIKEILGHANLAATQIYTHNSIDRLKKIHTQAHPRG